MTQDQRAKLEAAARELWNLLEGARPYYGPTRDLPVKAIMEALAAQRATVLEEAFAGLKVSNEALRWALNELGPTGTKAEAYIKAAVEYLMFLREAQEQRP